MQKYAITGNWRRLPEGRARLFHDWSVEECSLQVTCPNTHFPFVRSVFQGWLSAVKPANPKWIWPYLLATRLKYELCFFYSPSQSQRMQVKWFSVSDWSCKLFIIVYTLSSLDGFASELVRFIQLFFDFFSCNICLRLLETFKLDR